MGGIALSLGLREDYFTKTYTADPSIQLGLMYYHPLDELEGGGEESWGVGEHTDYGLLTLLHQDDIGGLQVGVTVKMYPLSEYHLSECHHNNPNPNFNQRGYKKI